MRNRLFLMLAATVAVAALLIGAYSYLTRSSIADDYNPVINPADFVPAINNRYFTLTPGKKFAYRNSSGTERVEIAVTRETKQIMGVTTTVVRATEWKDGNLKEDTRDWYAQDKDGNVWYFGEAVDNYAADGKVKDHDGSWEAGVKGAKPGIVMLARPRVGQTYRHEYYEGEAEDMGTVVALDQKVTTPAGTFDGCIKIKDWSTLEWGSEYKYYCPGVGFLALVEPTWFFGGAKTELISVSEEK